MPRELVSGVSDALPFDIHPPAGEAWCITDFFSSIRLVGGVPDLSVSFADGGVHTAGLIVIDPFTAIQKQDRKMELYIDNTTYLTVAETGAASVIGWTGYKVIPENLRSRIVTVPNGGKFTVRPPVGEIWKVCEIGSETIHAAFQPDVIMTLESATNTGAIIAQGTMLHYWSGKMAIYLSHDFYLVFDEITGADCDIGLSITRVPVEIFAGAQQLLADATVDIRPAEGYEAVVTTWGSDTWGGGGGTADAPNVRLSLTNGVLDSTIRSEGSVIVDTANCDRRVDWHIDNTIYLTMFEPTSGNQEICWSGYTRRIEHTT